LIASYTIYNTQTQHNAKYVGLLKHEKNNDTTMRLRMHTNQTHNY